MMMMMMMMMMSSGVVKTEIKLGLEDELGALSAKARPSFFA